MSSPRTGRIRRLFRFDTPLRKTTAAVVLLFVLISVYSAVRIAIMAVSLNNTYGALTALKSSSSNLSTEEINRHIDDAVSASAAAASGADDPIVKMWTALPVFGADLNAVATLSRDGHSVLQAAQQAVKYALSVTVAKPQSVAPGGLSTVAALRDSVVVLDSALQNANSDISFIDPARLHFGFGQKFATAQNLLAKAATASSVANPMIQVSTDLLEAKGTQHWFIATQNLAEARARGGIIGAYSVLSITNGKATITSIGSDKTLLAMGPINYSSYPQDLRDLWGVNLADWRDINASAHAPYAAKLIYDGWYQKTHQKLDGVLFVGQGTVAHLIAAAGPVSVAGNNLNYSNIVAFLSKDIYAKYPDVTKKNLVVGQVMQAIFTNLSTKKINVTDFLASLLNESTGDRMTAWSSHATEQTKFASEGVAGVVSEQMGSNVLVTMNNGGGNKLDAYSHLKIDYTRAECSKTTADGYPGRASQVSVAVTNAAPKSGLPAYVTPRLDDDFGTAPRPKGSNRELVTVYGPVGSYAESLSVNGKDYLGVAGVDRMHPVWVFDIELQPGETKTLRVNLIEPIIDENLVALSAAPKVIAPITLNPAAISVTAGPTCSY